MSQGYKYSVIIPAYNCEKTLQRCLDSLLAQKRQDVQIVVINDGSQDETERIGMDYANECPQVVYIRQENKGVSAARNAGLRRAEGQYVSFVDSDDYVTPDYFTVLDKIEGHDLLVFDRMGVGGYVRDDTAVFAQLTQIDNTEKRLELLLSSKKIMMPYNKCFSLGLIRQSGLQFPEGIHIGEDFAFCMAYAVDCKHIAIEPSKVYCVDASDGRSLSRKYRKNLDEQLYSTVIAVAHSIRESNLEPEYKKKLLTILDFLHCKNAIVSIAEAYKEPQFNRKEYQFYVKKVCKQYQEELSENRWNNAHWVLRYLLRNRIYSVICLAAYIGKGHAYRKQMRGKHE